MFSLWDYLTEKSIGRWKKSIIENEEVMKRIKKIPKSKPHLVTVTKYGVIYYSSGNKLGFSYSDLNLPELPKDGQQAMMSVISDKLAEKNLYGIFLPHFNRDARPDGYDYNHIEYKDRTKTELVKVKKKNTGKW